MGRLVCGANGLSQLIRAGCGSSSAQNARQLFLNLLYRHALNQNRYSLKISVAAPCKADVIHLIAVDIQAYQLRTGVLRFIVKMKHYSSSSTFDFTFLIGSVGSNRAEIFPSRSIRNFVKFHFTLPLFL